MPIIYQSGGRVIILDYDRPRTRLPAGPSPLIDRPAIDGQRPKPRAKRGKKRKGKREL